MRSPAKLTLKLVLSLTLCAALMPAAGSAFTTTPHPPTVTLPKPDEVARFKMTVTGKQTDSESFYRAPEADGCSLHIEGTLSEGWSYRRNNGVTMEFRKYGHKVYLQRAGRQIGDSAFATQGDLRRDATGFMTVKTGPVACVSFPLPDPTACGKTVKAPLDLRLDYLGGAITLKGSGPSAAKPNPLEKCGLIPSGGTSFNQLSNAFPFMLKQKGSLSARKIFGRKRKIEIELKPRFLQPLDPTGYTTFTETFRGSSDLTLIRQ